MMAYLIFLLLLFAAIIFAAVKLKGAGYLAVAAKGAFGSLFVFLVGCFTYGLFNRFSFWHGASPPGVDSGIAYAVILGITVGPIVFVVGGAIAAALARMSRQRR